MIHYQFEKVNLIITVQFCFWQASQNPDVDLLNYSFHPKGRRQPDDHIMVGSSSSYRVSEGKIIFSFRGLKAKVEDKYSKIIIFIKMGFGTIRK